MGVSFDVRGNWSKTDAFLAKMKAGSLYSKLSSFGDKGVVALERATPQRSGKTAASWSYDISSTGKGYKITWTNSNINRGAHIAILLQYGHGTPGGTFVQGRDFINPAMRPVFDAIADEAWRVVTDG